MQQALKGGNKEVENIVLIGPIQCLQLFSGILDETYGKTGHLLGKEQVLRNIQKNWISGSSRWTGLLMTYLNVLLIRQKK